MIISLDHNDQPASVSKAPRTSRRSWLTLEVTGQRQRKRNAVSIDLALDALPCSHKHYSLGRIASGSLQDAVEVLALVIQTSSVVGVALTSNLDAEALEYLL